jgi:hypothetical protein
MKNIKNLELFWRLLITGIFWLVNVAIMGVATLVLYWAGGAMPAIGYALPVLFGLLVTLLIWNRYGWEVIKDEKMAFFMRQIEMKLSGQLQDLSEAELHKALADIEQAKREFGLTTTDTSQVLPKTKRDVVSERIKALSDSDLLHVKSRLEDATLNDNEIIHLLDTIQAEVVNRKSFKE